MITPLVSICIPTYHRPHLLERAIKSVFSQTYSNWEVIITDNSTKNDSEELISRLNHPRIRYYRNKENIGTLNNIKKVASLATGTYLTVLMDDDLLKPEALALMVQAFETNPSAGVVMAPMALIDEDDRRIYPYFYLFRKMYYRYRFQVGSGLIPRQRVLKEFLVHDYPCCVPSGIMYRADAVAKVGHFDTAADFAIDLDLAMRLSVHYDFYYIDQVLSAFRYTPISMTSAMHSRGFNMEAFYYITRKILSDHAAIGLFSQNEQKRLVRDSIFFCSCRALLNALAGIRARNWKNVTDTVRTIFRHDPYLWNKLRLPWFVLREIVVSFIPPAKPLPKE